MLIRGTVWKFGDDISTDHIAPGRYFHLRSNLEEFAKHVLEDADPEFVRKMSPGDFVAAGRNFGLGSSREHAPIIMKMAGVGAVLAKSFARIFYRNAINVGLPVIQCDTGKIQEGDVLQLDLGRGKIADLTQGIEIEFLALPPFMRRILLEGGLIAHVNKHGDFYVE